LAGVWEVDRRFLSDERGTFGRLYCAREFHDAGAVTGPIVQMNLSRTTKIGTVRGLHFQRSPGRETKVVTCRTGEVWDVVVDLRQSSPTFLEWHATLLDGVGQTSLVVPPGCAQGFQTLTEDCELLYLHTAEFDPSLDAGVLATDPRLDLPWPLPISLMSERDQHLPRVAAALRGGRD